MPHYPAPNQAPYDLAHEHAQCLFDDDGDAFPIVRRTRRNIVIDRHGVRIELKRRRLERDGHDIADSGDRFNVTTYHQTKGTTP